MEFVNRKLSVKAAFISGLLFLVVLGFMPSVLAGNDMPDSTLTVGSITISGNKKTLDNIIFRELLVNSGESYSQDEFSRRISQSRLNLLNTSLFNFVTIDTVAFESESGPVSMDVKISVIERWYIWPLPILQITDRNFNSWLQTRDFTRINYGVDVKWYNFSGRLDELDFTVQFGKNRHFSVAYQRPYIDKKKRFGLGFESGYFKNRETGYITRNDKLEFAFVPEGLTSEKYVSVNATFRNSIFTTHQLVAGIRACSFSDSLLSLNPDYSYAGMASPVFFNVYYKLKIDHRDIKYYPLKGWYADIEINKSGLGFGFEEQVNVTWAKTTSRLYSKLANRWYTGISFIGKISSAQWQPYFQIQALGYSRDYVRGYEYNVIDGKHFALFRSNIKYALVPERIQSIGFIPTPKFGLIHYALYLTMFADVSYVWQPQWIGLNSNVLPRTWLAGAGMGLDLVTYYDKVVRIEYAVNKSCKSGIFIHFIAGI